MRLVSDSHGARWIMSDGEREAQQARALGLPVRIGERPIVQASDSASALLLPEERRESEASDRLTFDPVVARSLKKKNRALFSGSCLKMPPSFECQIPALATMFLRTEYQKFGYRGSPGFFSGRKIKSGCLELAACELQGHDHDCDPVTALARAVARAIYPQCAGVILKVGVMLSRHTLPVDRLPPHQDDVGWLAQFNVSRTAGVHGGAAQVLSLDGELIEASPLLDPFDGYIIRDEHYLHSTGALDFETLDDHRDVVIFRFSDPLQS